MICTERILPRQHFLPKEAPTVQKTNARLINKSINTFTNWSFRLSNVTFTTGYYSWYTMKFYQRISLLLFEKQEIVIWTKFRKIIMVISPVPVNTCSSNAFGHVFARIFLTSSVDILCISLSFPHSIHGILVDMRMNQWWKAHYLGLNVFGNIQIIIRRVHDCTIDIREKYCFQLIAIHWWFGRKYISIIGNMIDVSVTSSSSKPTTEPESITSAAFGMISTLHTSY